MDGHCVEPGAELAGPFLIRFSKCGVLLWVDDGFPPVSFLYSSSCRGWTCYLSFIVSLIFSVPFLYYSSYMRWKSHWIGLGKAGKITLFLPWIYWETQGRTSSGRKLTCWGSGAMALLRHGCHSRRMFQISTFYFLYLVATIMQGILKNVVFMILPGN